MDNKRALSGIPKLWYRSNAVGRGAFQVQRREVVRFPGAPGKANVGISNDNPGEKPGRR